MADHTVDQRVMDELIVACSIACVPRSGDRPVDPDIVAYDVCAFAEAIYKQRQSCIEERAKADGERREKEAGRVRGSKVLQIKPEDMTGGMP